MSWMALMVSALADCKRDDLRRGRLDFDAAWWACEHRYGHLAGGVGEVTSLFDERGEPHDSLPAFFRRVAEDAYYDRGAVPGKPMEPPIRNFRPEMIRDLDSSEPARRSWGSQGRHRQAA